MEPKFVKIDEMTAVGIPTLSSTKHNIIPKLWERTMKRADEIKNIADEKLWLGVCYQAEQLKDCCSGENCNEMQFFYLAGRPVKNTDNIPEGMAYKVIPAGEFAVFTHKGKLDNLDKTYCYIYGEWLPKSGKEYDCASCDFEWYDERFKYGEEDSEFDIYVPIK